MKIQRETVLVGYHRLWHIAIIGAWILVNIIFWSWWLTPAFRGTPLIYWLVSLAFFYDATYLPSVFLYYLGKMKKPVHVPASEAKDSITKVALITLTVPGSENIDIVESQLTALRDVLYPHDSWILVDKVHSPEIEELAGKYGVFYFSRHDVQKWGEQKVAYWNQPNPPFKAKTKAGNVNAWIDAYGENYSHFTQFDIDHAPIEEYLDRVLGYFADPKVAWVQAPSVYDNFSYWMARGSTEQEFILQGPLQMGFYGATDTPFIVGSHSTYRMSSIREIGGFQPTRAEDHLDTLYLAAKGYKGVYLPEIIATGDGPETFETYLAQQFAWSYSLMQVLLFHTPKMIWKLRPRLAFQMLFCETWYPLWSLMMIILFTSPIVSLLTGNTIANVSFWEFLVRYALLHGVAFLAWGFSRRWHQPKSVFLSWRGMILQMARWSVVLSAIMQALFQVTKPYMITQKGNNKGYSVSAKAFHTYIVLGATALLTNIWYVASGKHGANQGYLLFNLEDAFFMWIIILAPFIISIRHLGKKAFIIQKTHSMIILLGLVGLVGVSTISFPLIKEAIFAEATETTTNIVASHETALSFNTQNAELYINQDVYHISHNLPARVLPYTIIVGGTICVIGILIWFTSRTYARRPKELSASQSSIFEKSSS